MSDTTEPTKTKIENPLGTEPVGRLLVQFAVPSIIALVVNSLYNIVDQIFIGNFVGELGNAATNIAFPLTILCMSLGLMFGIGGAAAFNLSMGRGDKEKAPWYIGNSATMLVLCGVVIMVITLLFLTPLLRVFGSPDEVLPYAQAYVGITAFGFPFQILEAGAGHLIRADGRPRASMITILSGAIVKPHGTEVPCFPRWRHRYRLFTAAGFRPAASARPTLKPELRRKPKEKNTPRAAYRKVFLPARPKPPWT